MQLYSILVHGDSISLLCMDIEWLYKVSGVGCLAAQSFKEAQGCFNFMKGGSHEPFSY